MKKVQRRYRDDISRLEAAYGVLNDLEITISLQDFSKLCERDQVKISAYTGLINYLEKTFNAKVKLYSKKKKL